MSGIFSRFVIGPQDISVSYQSTAPEQRVWARQTSCKGYSLWTPWGLFIAGAIGLALALTGTTTFHRDDCSSTRIVPNTAKTTCLGHYKSASDDFCAISSIHLIQPSFHGAYRVPSP